MLLDEENCIPHPCHFGTCTDGVDTYTCSCFAGYEGDDCKNSK